MLFHVIFIGRLGEHNLIAASIKCMQNLSGNCSEYSQMNIVVKSTNNGLSAFIWKLDHNPLLSTVFKIHNDGLAGALTKYANCTKSGGIESCAGQYPFYSVIYTVKCSAPNAFNQCFMHSHATATNLQTVTLLFPLHFIY